MICFQKSNSYSEEQKRGPPTPPKKCSEVVVEPFDDGWPEYEESFTMMQGSNH
jgi:hypothetical protein